MPHGEGPQPKRYGVIIGRIEGLGILAEVSRAREAEILLGGRRVR